MISRNFGSSIVLDSIANESMSLKCKRKVQNMKENKMIRFKFYEERLMDDDVLFSDIVKSYQPRIDELEKEGIQCRLIEIDDGIGASGPAVMGILTVGTGLFFGVPELYKRIGDAIKGWRVIYRDAKKAIKKVAGSTESVHGYSVEYALLHVVNELSNETDVDELVLEAIIAIPGKGIVSDGASFETASVSQYTFIFRDGRDYLYNECINSDLEIQSKHKLLLDPRYKN